MIRDLSETGLVTWREWIHGTDSDTRPIPPSLPPFQKNSALYVSGIGPEVQEILEGKNHAFVTSLWAFYQHGAGHRATGR